ncbi:PCC domain-containing protein [Microbacterium binotii]|uniref:PCC domain-containing protein n=1 Tax=Microbacterium binotii TaxID=462710 RepID=UPI001F1C203C|nr:PPC domain-containing DNA-binding protein [Microbacterium binotii]UIN30955.1 DNA-binding protein [Microbacterium binotii]
MQTAEIQTGRRVVVVLEPGDEILTSLADACRRHGIAQAAISTFSGAFRTVRLIAAETPAADPEAPMPTAVDVPYTEGLGSGTITTASDGALVVHVHVAVGVKDDAARAYAGHLLSGETHYVVEVVLDEILSPVLERRPHPGSAGLPILQIAPATAP